MGFTINLQDEFGGIVESLHDPTNLLHGLLPAEGEHPMLAGIDFYGDTVFNRPQMKRFLDEWLGVEAKAKTPEAREITAAVRKLAQRCDDEVHLYLKFEGD